MDLSDPAVLAYLATIYPMPSGDPAITTKVIAAIWVMASISTVFLAARIYCRASHIGSIWWDDACLMVAWVFLITAVSLQTEIFRLGYLVTALSGPDIGPRNLASDSCMKLALAFSKTSFALTVWKISAGWTRYIVYVVAVVMNVTCVVHAILVWRASCGTEEAFNFEPCWSSDSGIWMNMVGSIISAITDFILVFLPVKIIMGLQMKRIEKIGVAVAMSIGIFAGAVSIVKAVESYGVVKVVGPVFSYRLANLSIWIHAEPNAAIVASSIPVLRVLFRQVVRKYGANSGDGGASGQYIKSNQQSAFHSAAVTAVNPDDSSGKSILPPTAEERKNQMGIHRTQQVKVEYDSSPTGGMAEKWQQPEEIEMSSYKRR